MRELNEHLCSLGLVGMGFPSRNPQPRAKDLLGGVHRCQELTEAIGLEGYGKGSATTGWGQSVLSWLKLELARVKELELDWLGLSWKQCRNPSLARLELKKL